MMRFNGAIKSWNDERGFGFIQPAQGGPDVFVHIKAFNTFAGRPQVNQRVSFQVRPGPPRQAARGRRRSYWCKASSASPHAQESDNGSTGQGQSLAHSAVFGGWPGALIAQHTLRHKSSKREFRSVFWATVALNITGYFLAGAYIRSVAS